ncbi:threonine synthase [Clostridium sp. MD294]|uniref:threonine synthase n=1 Tax=Clostridium sp. MD294 TaxID=97138 RepID=UPI0002C92F50|nr:threonine synthase [Clostridium sp. MD294]NDO45532.1 threonine synthase [Clostridium sp. MD294]USF30816.1 Threonine synthase [Clostridium sp. MD294]
MNYIGTRDNTITATASQAILQGICKDGGLFIPEQIPQIDKTLSELSKLNYKELAYEILKLYLTDFTEQELKYCIQNAYDTKFDTPEIVPLVKKEDALFLELFHGKTLAFKDMALSILPYFMKTAAKKNGIEKEIVILTATSGDTGKAALEGFAEVEGTKIIVFFPEDGVSAVQKLQMTTQQGNNTCVVGIKGNFDDAQTAVKSIFTDEQLSNTLEQNGYMFSSANSINIGRLVPQIVYYFYAYMQAVKQCEIKIGDKLNFTVPTGNFGDILAGYYAKCMGLPVNHFVCASNDNKVLYDFFETGVYDKNRAFHVTISPSMDILISSNLERFLCHTIGQQKTKECMIKLQKEGNYSIEAVQNSEISGEYATQQQTYTAIKQLYEQTGYVMDTHTAVAYAAYQKYKQQTNDDTPMVIVSTASPYKFTKDVMIALDESNQNKDTFLLMKKLQEVSGVKIPASIQDIEKRKVLHNNVCEKQNIKQFVTKYLLG